MICTALNVDLKEAYSYTESPCSFTNLCRRTGVHNGLWTHPPSNTWEKHSPPRALLGFPPREQQNPMGLPLPAHNMTDTPTFTLSLQGWPTSTGVLWPQGVTLQSRQPATARGREWNVHQGSASLFKIFHSQRPAESVTDTDKGVIIQRLKASLLSLFD